MNSVTFDHPDPSIFTVLTASTEEVGVAVVDFVIFPKRWQVQWDSFRIPYYHRNCMTEYMGNIYGTYEAKPDAFPPGAGSLHSCMAGHGPDSDAFERATNASEDPHLLSEGISFMFESTYIMRLTKHAMSPELLDNDYHKCWLNLKSHFNNTIDGSW
jgi:homogentisate 1,2-dioxygenase